MSILIYSMLFACSGDKADDSAVAEETAAEPAAEIVDSGEDTAEESGE